ncbi:hypothetical protein HTZ84_05255 [Haloterrigena sp. SYSU A558-1]|uniref:Uncharacterized protein n=1 Tax=Haloterrigena gelatinilytica TaxID=2741724 RepID=A0ABX2LD17_9EURY|nr:hypothetical protein [Haloterrigena gelatinilytica]NUC71721.1 hypothetical protein [Haloterrigena gelatinilytica]
MNPLKAILECLEWLLRGQDRDNRTDTEPEPEEPEEPEPLEALDLESDDQQQAGQSHHSGVRIRAEQDLEGLECRISDQTSGLVMAYLKDGGGDILERRSIDTLEAGDTFTFTTPLEAGKGYQVVCAAGGAPYDRGRSHVEYPIKSEVLVATAGIYTGGGTETTRYCYNIDQIRPLRSVEEDQPQVALGAVKPSDPMPDYHSATGLEATRGENCYVVDDPAGGDEKVLEVFYPEEEILGINERVYLENAVGYEPKVVHGRYEIFFPETFEIRQGYHHGGTKLPGVADHRGDPPDNEGGGAGGVRNPGSYSDRKFASSRDGLYNETVGADIPINSQVYDATYDPRKHPYGWHHCWSKGVNKGSWYTIDYRTVLNTPGESDGRILGWINGELAFDSDELAKEDDEFDGYLFLEEKFAERGIPYWRRHYHYGGEWGSPKDQSLYERNLSIWVDDNVPEM